MKLRTLEYQVKSETIDSKVFKINARHIDGEEHAFSAFFKDAKSDNRPFFVSQEIIKLMRIGHRSAVQSLLSTYASIFNVHRSDIMAKDKYSSSGLLNEAS